jgi:transcriptional regulator with XRE-family HTH domain
MPPASTPSDIALSKAVAVRVVRLRQAQRLTQRELAERLGIDVPTLSRYETGRRVFPLGVLFRVAEKLRVPVASLLTEGSGHEHPLLAACAGLDDQQMQLLIQVAQSFARAERAPAE